MTERPNDNLTIRKFSKSTGRSN